MPTLQRAVHDELAPPPAVVDAARELLGRLPHPSSDTTVRAERGGQQITVPDTLLPFLERILSDAAQGHTFQVMSMPDALTTTQAAAMLDLSRPTVIKRARDGEIPFHMVGSHMRFRTEDVLRLREKKQALALAAFERAREAQDDAGIVA